MPYSFKEYSIKEQKRRLKKLYRSCGHSKMLSFCGKRARRREKSARFAESSRRNSRKEQRKENTTKYIDEAEDKIEETRYLT